MFPAFFAFDFIVMRFVYYLTINDRFKNYEFVFSVYLYSYYIVI